MAAFDISTIGTRTEYFSSGNGTSASCVLTSDGTTAKVVLAYRDNVNDGFARMYNVTLADGTMSAPTSAFEFDTADCTQLRLITIDSTHVLAVWRGTLNDGFARILNVDTSAGTITGGTALEFDTADLQYPALVKIDSTHFLVVWQGTSNGKAQVLTMNTGTGVITAEGSATNIGSNLYSFDATAISSTKYAVACAGTVDEDLKVVILDVNTSTWAVSVTTAATTVETATTNSPAITYLETSGSNDVIAIFSYDGTTQKIRTYNVNTSTWAVTSRGAQFNTTWTGLNTLSSGFIKKIDATHFIAQSNGISGSVQANVGTYLVNSSSGDISSIDTAVVGASNTDNIKSCEMLNAIDIATGYWLGSWRSDTDDGELAQLILVDMATSTIKTVDGLGNASVKTVDGLARASVKTINGLA